MREDFLQGGFRQIGTCRLPGCFQSLTFRLLPNQSAPLTGTISPMALVTEITIPHTAQLIGQPPLNCTLTNLHSVVMSIASFSHKIQVKMNGETTALGADQPGDECHKWGPRGPWPEQWSHSQLDSSRFTFGAWRPWKSNARLAGSALLSWEAWPSRGSRKASVTCCEQDQWSV